MELQVYKVHSDGGIISLSLEHQGDRPIVSDHLLLKYLEGQGLLTLEIGSVYFVNDNLMNARKFMRVEGTPVAYKYSNGLVSTELVIGRQIGELVSVEIAGVDVCMQVVLTTDLIDAFKAGQIKSIAGITLTPATTYCVVELEV